MARGDVITLDGEKITPGREYRYFHPMIDYRHFSLSASDVRPMLKKRIENGKRTEKRLPDSEQLRVSRATMMEQMETFDGSYKRILNPHIYKVSLSEGLRNMKLDFINANERAD